MDFIAVLYWVATGLWQPCSEAIPAPIWLSEHKWPPLIYDFWHAEVL